jgi:hypothetical protein
LVNEFGVFRAVETQCATRDNLKMTRLIYGTGLAVLLIALVWFQFFQNRSFAEVQNRVEGYFDKRPAREILIIGNSRTYYHDMPDMLRDIAESAGSPMRYQTTLRAFGGASFESLWSDSETQSLLSETWDDAIFQGESRGQSSADQNSSFVRYGEKLLDATKLRSGKPRLVINWAYDSNFYQNDKDGKGREAHIAFIRESHKTIAQHNGARLIDMNGLWEYVRATHPKIVLTEDGNHPTLAGSYLFALFLYADLSASDLAKVGYMPEGLPTEDARALLEAVKQYRMDYP